MTDGEKILELRKHTDMTFNEIARQLNVSLSTVFRWVAKGSPPRSAQVNRICGLFGLTLEQYLGMTHDNKAEVLRAVRVGGVTPAQVSGDALHIPLTTVELAGLRRCAGLPDTTSAQASSAAITGYVKALIALHLQTVTR